MESKQRGGRQSINARSFRCVSHLETSRACPCSRLTSATARRCTVIKGPRSNTQHRQDEMSKGFEVMTSIEVERKKINVVSGSVLASLGTKSIVFSQLLDTSTALKCEPVAGAGQALPTPLYHGREMCLGRLDLVRALELAVGWSHVRLAPDLPVTGPD